MKGFIEKLVNRLNELVNHYEEGCNSRIRKGLCAKAEDCGRCAFIQSIEIVKELEKDYSANTPQKFEGWIPCSERLPDEDKIVLLCTEKGLVRQGVRHISHEHNRYDLYGVTSTFWDKEVVAWQTLPAPCKEGE